MLAVLCNQGPYPPIEGFDTVQESYAMSDRCALSLHLDHPPGTNGPTVMNHEYISDHAMRAWRDVGRCSDSAEERNEYSDDDDEDDLGGRAQKKVRLSSPSQLNHKLIEGLGSRLYLRLPIADRIC